MTKETQMSMGSMYHATLIMSQDVKPTLLYIFALKTSTVVHETSLAAMHLVVETQLTFSS